MTNLKQQVKEILVECPEARNSDITLTIKIWQKFYNVREAVDINRLYLLPREDNIKRIRAKFAEEKWAWAMPTNKEIAKRRRLNEDKWREDLGYKPTIQTQNTLI